MPEGDEIPRGCIEVAYLTGVFHNAGSALGFRMGDDVVRWSCFDRPITEAILDKSFVEPDLSGNNKLFDHVGTVSKGICVRRVKGSYPEHKGWHESLWKAMARPVKLRLTWRNSGAEWERSFRLRDRSLGDQRQEDDHDGS